MSKQTHRTCVRMSVEEYSRLMERSKAAGLPAKAWLMEQLTDNRPIISRDGVMPDFLRLLNQKGREINTVARAFNSGYGTAEELRQALDCLKDIAQAAYEIRKEGVHPCAVSAKSRFPEGNCGTTAKASPSG